MSLKGKITLVTGASRGIGRAIAENLGHQGAVIIGTATTEAGAKAITDSFQEKNILGEGWVLDVCNEAAIDQLFDGVKQKYQQDVEILVNNAGITMDNILVRMKPEQWDKVIDTNLNAVFKVVRRAARAMMKARAGRIVNISSLSGVMGNFGQSNYAAAKAGVIGFSKSLAQEMAPYGVTVNCVAPGFIDTDMVSKLTEAQLTKIQEWVPMRRLGKPEEVASVVSFLVSEGGAYVTGETINVNGGLYMA